jgi:NitT/TauT family transport system substrate-binding protein
MSIVRSTVFAMATAVGLAALPAPTSALAQEVTKLRVGYLPIGVYSYLWRARDAGYFKEENIEVELIPMAGGGQIIPALQSGSLEFGISDALGVLNARNGGIPVTYVSFNFQQTSEDPVHAVLTLDPDIKSGADLAGKDVATNLSYNTDWTMMREWLRQQKADPDSITFKEIPFPDMLAALRSKTVAAAGVTEPFVTLGEAEGARVIGYYFTDVKSPNVLSGVTAMLPYVKESPEVTKSFVKAINRAIEDFKDPAIVRETIAANTKIPAEVVAKMHLGEWNKDVPADSMQFWVDAAKKEGILSSDVDLNDIVWKAE